MARKSSIKNLDLNDRLVLSKYFLSLIGEDSISKIGNDFKDDSREVYDEDNISYYYYHLLPKFSKHSNISKDKLLEYDQNLYRHVKRIGEKRGGIKLKYFQYLALLFTEIFLDKYFFDTENFINELNQVVNEYNLENPQQPFIEYTKENIGRIAYMCATGSGKTFIMHINILQFQHYYKKAKKINPDFEINRYIVLTPNEGLSNQHAEEMELSNIPYELFHNDFLYNEDAVIIIDINKLKEEGKIKTVSVDSFMKNNVLFVDEGHKGLGGEVWLDYRNRLSEEGFVFEYSATFKQALKGEKSIKDEESIIDIYGKSIIIDYSYKYFYNDMYGKEYRIYNLEEDENEKENILYLTGCLLTYYQQLKLFNVYSKEYDPYNLEKPLLVCVGNSVNKRSNLTKGEKEVISDVQKILVFIDGFTSNYKKSIENIRLVLSGDTGLIQGNKDLFYNDFTFLQDLFEGDVDALYRDVLNLIFNSNSSGRLYVEDLKQINGEIGLKIGDQNEYFGVINVGENNQLIKNCESIGIVTSSNEFITESLFRNINEKSSKINMLVGSRKFTEGWNSYRVSTMVFFNFAREEGSLAIQLFGRGVRLKGYKNLLKRSDAFREEKDPPRYIKKLETLTIFGVRADYMKSFKQFLEYEEVPADKVSREYKLPTVYKERLERAKKSNLKVITLPSNINFKKKAKRLLITEPTGDFYNYIVNNKIKHDAYSKVQALTSIKDNEIVTDKHKGYLSEYILSFVDMNEVLAELQRYKSEKGYHNIIISKDECIKILCNKEWYVLYISEKQFKLDSFDKIVVIEDVCRALLKKYIDSFYKYHKKEWERPYLKYETINENNIKNNLVKEYLITLYNRSQEDFDSFEKFIRNLSGMLKGDEELSQQSKFEFTAFDYYIHLYVPLVNTKNRQKIEVRPVGLNVDEKRFVDLLKEYINNYPSLFADYELYLLRNKPKVGIGFFEAGNFYPDFILWVANDKKQYINFIDPKGIMLLDKGLNNEKIKFSETIKDLQEQLQETDNSMDIVLNSFIMSGTSFSDVKNHYGENNKMEYEKLNVFFLEDEDCIEKVFNKILGQ